MLYKILVSLAAVVALLIGMALTGDDKPASGPQQATNAPPPPQPQGDSAFKQ